VAVPPYVAVIGPGGAVDDDLLATARRVGELLARRGAVLVCGGLDGVMAAAVEGAAAAGGTSVGLLPGRTREGAAAGLTVALPTGLGEGRNVLVVRAAEVVIAVGGSWGTLSEIALAVRGGLPVVAVRGWSVLDGSGNPLPGVAVASSADDAVALAMAAL